ncbi:hypothetical protein Sste5346_006450 [Sporothrix stenoceras]|uniref:Centrosomin N-terminal motif 1 domain-containing protein n=1 Tax=Sporothrix stenoceras TaxID=5173 RepID=A0ABR3YY13_9PEZI
MSNLTPSPQPPLSQLQQQTSSSQPSSHLVHRFQNSTANKRASPAPSTSTDSSRFRSLNDSTSELKSSDSKPSLIATSSYLQEKLLKERKVESERSSSRLGNDKMASTVDLGGAQSSPARAPFDISRPKSSAGHLDGGKKKAGVGLKEMEQTLTNLHKQNFDLKLELYHRREKQTALEEQCESLESEKHELEEINDKLMSELEMRDKAVEEAVAMIVSLEARLEELFHEREMMQQAEKEKFFATDARLRNALSSALHETTNVPTAPESVTSFDDTPKPKTKTEDLRTINRMPSFVSERSELTENLRNVYLGTRVGSLVSLPRMSEDNDLDMRDVVNRIASPSLSVLSESSFLSIYGKKREIPAHITSAPTEPRPMSPVACVPDIPRTMPDNSHSMNIEDSNGSAAAVVAHALASTAAPQPTPTQTRSSSTPTKKRSSSSNRNPHLSANQNAAAFNALTDFLGTNSPLRQLEKMEMSLQAMNDASRPASQHGHGRAEIEQLARHLREHELGKSYARQEKKDALRRVRTDAPFSREPHNLPPTPDTISTSTLRRYKNSNDTLCLQDKENANERSYLTVSEVNTSRSSSGENKRISTLESFVDSIPAMHPPSTSAFDSRRHEVGGRSSYFDNQLHIPPRPRSADETTISHHGRGSVWGDSESSDDDMDIDGNDSASLHDYWLRESLRPTGQAPAPSKSRSRRGGRVSPDLFSFPPTTSNGWATTAMFGSLSGQGYQGSAPLAQTLDALGASLPSPAAGLFGPSGLLASPLPYGMNGIPSGPPPPPHRRSSLHAHTGSTNGSRSGSRHGTAPGTPSLGTPSLVSNKNRRSPTRPGTTASKDSNDIHSNQPPTPIAAPTQQDQITLPKQRHYPPASGSNNNATRSRVMSLFRRSGSHEPSSAATAALTSSATVPNVATMTESTSNPAAPNIGVPSRSRRSELDEDNAAGASATPPPILRNPRPVRGAEENGVEVEAKDVMPVSAPAPQETAPVATTAAPPLQQEVRKKWLGRVTGLRNRAG